MSSSWSSRWRSDSPLPFTSQQLKLKLSAVFAVCFSHSSNNLTALNISLLSTLARLLRKIEKYCRCESGSSWVAGCWLLVATGYRMQDAGCSCCQRLLRLLRPNDGLRWKCLKLTRALSSNKSFANVAYAGARRHFSLPLPLRGLAPFWP